MTRVIVNAAATPSPSVRDATLSTGAAVSLLRDDSRAQRHQSRSDGEDQFRLFYGSKGLSAADAGDVRRSLLARRDDVGKQIGKVGIQVSAVGPRLQRRQNPPTKDFGADHEPTAIEDEIRLLARRRKCPPNSAVPLFDQLIPSIATIIGNPMMPASTSANAPPGVMTANETFRKVIDPGATSFATAVLKAVCVPETSVNVRRSSCMVIPSFLASRSVTAD